MGILGAIVTAPVAGPAKGFMWLIETLIEHAERELYDEGNIRRDLMKLEQKFESGAITLEVYEAAESELLERLNYARRLKEGR